MVDSFKTIKNKTSSQRIDITHLKGKMLNE